MKMGARRFVECVLDGEVVVVLEAAGLYRGSNSRSAPRRRWAMAPGHFE